MNLIEIIAVVALVGFAVNKQTRRAEVVANGRFKKAAIYGLVGLAVGGLTMPQGSTAALLLAASIALSVLVGVARGHYTRVWAELDGRVFRQGTRLTVGLFLGMVAVKFGIGTYAYLHQIQDGGGFAEILLMMAVMMAVQAQMIHVRAGALTGARLYASAA